MKSPARSKLIPEEKPDPSKYRNVRVEDDGYKFDSKAEHRRYKNLCLLQKANEIADLEVHPKYVILDSFKDRKGKTIRKITYEADFQYTDIRTGETIVEDVKGVETAVFKIKKKMFLKRYPEYEFVIVKSKEV